MQFKGIKNGVLIIGLDGSVTNYLGAYSFCFFKEDVSSIYMHHGPVHGDSGQQNSTQPEMHGILWITYLLRTLSYWFVIIVPRGRQSLFVCI